MGISDVPFLKEEIEKKNSLLESLPPKYEATYHARLNENRVLRSNDINLLRKKVRQILRSEVTEDKEPRKIAQMVNAVGPVLGKAAKMAGDKPDKATIELVANMIIEEVKFARGIEESVLDEGLELKVIWDSIWVCIALAKEGYSMLFGTVKFSTILKFFSSGVAYTQYQKMLLTNPLEVYIAQILIVAGTSVLGWFVVKFGLGGFFNSLKGIWNWTTRVLVDRIVKIRYDKVQFSSDMNLTKEERDRKKYLDVSEKYRFSKKVMVSYVDAPNSTPFSIPAYTPFIFHGYLSIGYNKKPPHFLWMRTIVDSKEDVFTRVENIKYIETYEGDPIDVE